MIIIKTEKEIEIMRKGGKILASILKKILNEIKPEVTTGLLEEMACEMMNKAGGRPAFKGYVTSLDEKPFPTCLCTSINSEIVHAPSLPSRILKDGDIIGIDIGMEYPAFENALKGKPDYNYPVTGYYTDMAYSIGVGRISNEAKKLLKVTKKALELAIKKAKPGNTINDIGYTVESYAESNGFSVVRDLVGHGVGKAIHEDPQVLNFKVSDKSSENITLRPGMTIAIEPMVNTGGWKIKYNEGEHTIVTADGSLSAQFEHTIAITKNGNIVLTAFNILK